LIFALGLAARIAVRRSHGTSAALQAPKQERPTGDEEVG